MKGALAAAFCIIVWGGTFVSTGKLLADFSALKILVLRFAVAYLALVALTRKRLVRKSRGDEWLFAGMGITGAVVYQLLENCAIYYTDAVNVSILTSAGPILTSVLVSIFYKEPLGGGSFWLGALIAMAGVLTVAIDGIVTFNLRPIGDGMVVVAMCCWGLYSVLVKIAIMKGYEPVAVIRRAFFWTLVALLPVTAWGTTESGWLALDGSLSIVLDIPANIERFSDFSNLLSLAFLGLFASAGCFVLWNVACRELGVVKSTLCIYFMPLVSIAISVVFGGEMPTLTALAGTLLIFIGVGLANFNRRIFK